MQAFSSMKKVFLLTIALLLISASCFAKVTEWVDPTYNFNDAKRMYIKLNMIQMEFCDVRLYDESKSEKETHMLRNGAINL